MSDFVHVHGLVLYGGLTWGSCGAYGGAVRGARGWWDGM